MTDDDTVSPKHKPAWWRKRRVFDRTYVIGFQYNGGVQQYFPISIPPFLRDVEITLNPGGGLYVSVLNGVNPGPTEYLVLNGYVQHPLPTTTQPPLGVWALAIVSGFFNACTGRATLDGSGYITLLVPVGAAAGSTYVTIRVREMKPDPDE